MPMTDEERRQRAAAMRAKQQQERERQRRWIADQTWLVGLGALSASVVFAGFAATSNDGTATTNVADGANSVNTTAARLSTSNAVPQGYDDDSDGWSSDVQPPDAGGWGQGGGADTTSGGS